MQCPSSAKMGDDERHEKGLINTFNSTIRSAVIQGLDEHTPDDVNFNHGVDSYAA